MMNRSDTVPSNMKIRMYNFMGIIYYHRNRFSHAVREFENSLNLLFQIRSYSPAMILAFNNIGCSYFRQKHLDKSV